MTEKPILFSGPMIRAILDGRKTQTRRVVKAPTPTDRSAALDAVRLGSRTTADMIAAVARCPYDADRLWVRETWRVRTFPRRTIELHEHDTQCIVEHDDETWWERWGKRSEGGRWQPSIYMPRWASRITLAVKSIRVERLHDITEEDARAEGVGELGRVTDARGAFVALWESINGERTGCDWRSNPWVWAVTRRR